MDTNNTDNKEKTDEGKKPTARELLDKSSISKVKKNGTFAGLNVNEMNSMLAKYKPLISQSVGNVIKPEKLIQQVVNLMLTKPELKECKASSIVASVMQAAELGLNISPSLGECYFVPYNQKTIENKKEVWTKVLQFQIGYIGRTRLARRSGQIKDIYSYPVYKDDEFDYQYGTNRFIKHKPSLDSVPKDEDIKFVYAVYELTNGGLDFIVLKRSQIENLRLRNKAQKKGIKGAWLTDYDEMAKGKALKKLLKTAPLSIEFHRMSKMDGNIPTMEQFKEDGTDIDLVQYEIVEDEILD